MKALGKPLSEATILGIAGVVFVGIGFLLAVFLEQFGYSYGYGIIYDVIRFSSILSVCLGLVLLGSSLWSKYTDKPDKSEDGVSA